MHASLPMYALPALAPAHQRLWAAIRIHLAQAGIPSPEHLNQEGAGLRFWRAPDLLFSQTCGLPYRAHLHTQVNLIGTPDYGLPGTPPGYYHSVLIKNRKDTRTELAAFGAATVAINDPGSQSGFAALVEASQIASVTFGEIRVTGAHAASVRAIAEGTADLAAIDAVTWQLLCTHHRVDDQVTAFAITRPTPGLPFICARQFDPDVLFDAVAAAIEGLEPNDRAALMLKGLVRISDSTYRAEPVPDATALDGS